MGDQHTVALVAMDGLQLLDLAGPVEVLYGAGYFAGTDLYHAVVATPGGRDVRSASGVRLGPTSLSRSWLGRARTSTRSRSSAASGHSRGPTMTGSSPMSPT